jgi:hypothetical protein
LAARLRLDDAVRVLFNIHRYAGASFSSWLKKITGSVV